MSQQPLLSIVTPFYTRTRDSYLFPRALDFITTSYTPSWMERIFIDQGSPTSVAGEMEAACRAHGIRYINLGRGNHPFSIGLCRNNGVQLATGEFISFQDVDLVAPEQVYEEIRNKLRDDLPMNHLEVVPCLYLTPSGSEKYRGQPMQDAHKELYDAYQENLGEIIQMAAPATSCVIVRRHFYLAEGGVREEFFGHGYEDFELMSRLGHRARKFHRPHDYYSHLHKYDSLEYKGYRTFFSMFGRQNLDQRIFYAHLHHEVASEPGYKERNARNKSLFESFLKNFDEKNDSPPALDDLTSDQTVLSIGTRTSIPFRGLRFALPYLGKTLYRRESDFRSAEEFSDFLSENKISRVLFLTPYGNDERLALYRWCRANDFPYMVFDRGALPNSWFFDDCGFNAESQSYDAKNWDHPLSPQEENCVQTYLQELCASDETLEANGPRKGAYELRRRFDLVDRKVIFVAMQRPADSVIRHFSGNVDSVEHFCQQISVLTQLLPQEWKVIVKQHPLEEYTPNIPGAIILPADIHVYDAISAADAVTLINSGVGLLSLCFEKPVFCFGKSFYAHAGLAETVTNAEELANRLKSNSQPSPEAVKRFMHHLVFNFYSFANTQYKKVTEGTSSRTIALDHEFTELRLPSATAKSFSFRTAPISTRAAAYSYFRSYFAARDQSKSDALAQAKKAPQNKSDHKVAAPTNVVKIKPDPEKIAKPQASPQQEAQVPPSVFARKARKLLRDPGLFFRDAFEKSA